MVLSYDEIKNQLIKDFGYKNYHFCDVENKNLQLEMTDLTNQYAAETNWVLANCWHFAGVDLGLFYIGG